MNTARWRNSVYLFLAVAGWASAPCGADEQPSAAVRADAADELAALIDRRIAEGWAKNQVEPAPATDDAEFLRRTYLNVAGRIPSVSEVLEFLDDPSLNKRRELVERLLESPGYLSNFTTFWRDVMIPEAANNVEPFRFNGQLAQFELWLRERLDRNAGFDRIVREVISGATEGRSEGNTLAFVQLKEGKAENLAAATSRAFLGVRLECAQCHNHPFAKWQRKDFWQLAAFYGGNSGAQNDFSAPGARKIKIPETDNEVQAAFLDATAPDFNSNPPPRTVLAKWVTSRENGYFARATVNRLWGHFFGIGIVNPVDDFDEQNPASHPELLEELAQAFVASNYDQKLIVRAITRSRPYQLASRRTHASQQNPQMFARMLVKGMTSDQLFDSLIWATGNAETQRNQRNVFVAGGQRQQFRELFGQQASAPGEVQTSILQALMMMNGAFVDQASSPQQSMTLSAIIDVPFFSNEQRLETLFLAALARPPRPDEAVVMLKHLDDQSPGNDWKQALGDVYWALLNSSEFSLNH